MKKLITTEDDTNITFEIPEFKLENKEITVDIDDAFTDCDPISLSFLGFVDGTLTVDGVKYKFELELNINAYTITFVYIEPCPIKDEFKKFLNEITYVVD